MLLIFSSKHAKRGRKLELTHLYTCWIMYIAYEAALASIKVARQRWAEKAFNIEEVWNLVCCHGNKTVELIL